MPIPQSRRLRSLAYRISHRWLSIVCFLILGLACPITLAANRTGPQIDPQLQRSLDIPLERLERPLQTLAGQIRPIDLNKTSIEQLVSLPDMNITMAQQVIEGRPYNSKTDLLHKRILSDTLYDRINNLIAAE
jgi:DNA uptake protein ComE-like DNA-binding protein